MGKCGMDKNMDKEHAFINLMEPDSQEYGFIMFPSEEISFLKMEIDWVENGEVRDLRVVEVFTFQIRMYMKESGNKMYHGDMERWNILMDLFIMEDGLMGKDMEQEWCYTKMEIYILENGAIIKDMDMASSLLKIKENMKENGKMIKCRDRVF